MSAAVQDADINAMARDVHHAWLRVQEAERHETRASETAQRRRVELGEQLLRARRLWPRSGPKAKGWGDFIAKIGIPQPRAWEALKSAGWVEEQISSGADEIKAPSLAESGARKKPPLSLVPDLAPEPEPPDVSAMTVPAAAEVNRDAWCTPEPIVILLPRELDLDPCSNPYSLVRAKVKCSLESGRCGLKEKWFGMMYANIPFSEPLPWFEKLVAEYRNLRGAGFMVNTDQSTKWWKLGISVLLERLDFGERLEFKPPPGVKASKNDRPQTLLMDEAFRRACNPKLLELGTHWKRVR